MKKVERQIEVLLASIQEQKDIEAVINALPRGYISVKQISGHTYYYRQWREGSRIVSFYVPEAFLDTTRQKIIIRKENEQLLRVIKKNVKQAAKTVIKAGLLSEKEVEELKEGKPYDEVVGK